MGDLQVLQVYSGVLHKMCIDGKFPECPHPFLASKLLYEPIASSSVCQNDLGAGFSVHLVVNSLVLLLGSRIVGSH